MGKCYFCTAEIPSTLGIYRTTQCPSCGKDLKICYNCSWYDASAPYECRESISDPVVDKDRANFCDTFRFSGARKPKPKSVSTDAFNKLFGD